MNEPSLKQRVLAAVREDVTIVDYDPQWPAFFSKESEFLYMRLPLWSYKNKKRHKMGLKASIWVTPGHRFSKSITFVGGTRGTWS